MERPRQFAAVPSGASLGAGTFKGLSSEPRSSSILSSFKLFLADLPESHLWLPVACKIEANLPHVRSVFCGSRALSPLGPHPTRGTRQMEVLSVSHKCPQHLAFVPSLMLFSLPAVSISLFFFFWHLLSSAKFS